MNPLFQGIIIKHTKARSLWKLAEMCSCARLVIKQSEWLYRGADHIMCEQQASTWSPVIHRALLFNHIVLLCVCLHASVCKEAQCVFEALLYISNEVGPQPAQYGVLQMGHWTVWQCLSIEIELYEQRMLPNWSSLYPHINPYPIGVPHCCAEKVAKCRTFCPWRFLQLSLYEASFPLRVT